jgi:hypothetical protein
LGASASATPPPPRPSFKEQWFGAITPDNVEAVIADLTKGWYTLGIIALLGYSFLAWIARSNPENLLDGFFCLIGGYFLVRRKSRALAGVLLVYALLVGAITFLGKFGVIAPQSGTNIILAVIAVAIAWRGCRATFVYQRKVDHRVSWKHVTWIWLSFILAEAVVFVVTIGVLKIGFPQLNDEIIGDLTVMMQAVFAFAYFVPITRRFPFHLSVEGTP